jgi:hypothetical protein
MIKRQVPARPPIRYFVMMLLAAAAAILGSTQGGMAQVKPQAAPKDLPGLALDDNHRVGAPHIVNNLAIFPIYAKVQEELSNFTTLEAALEKGTAVVRELGATPAQDQPPQQQAGQSRRQAPQPQIARSNSDNAQVNTLVIENKGTVPILVLAGTVVKGGKQDRQIGEDFIISANTTSPVDAYCVEHGRWNAERDGVSTGGTFKATKMLATSKVRAAGQHSRNQSGVWAEVSAVNAANKKSAASDTLMATLDDKEVAAKRAAITTKATSFFASAEAKEKIVGLAYAVDGKVRAVRWFWNNKLFNLHKDTLLQTAAVEAITAESAGGPGQAAKAPPATPAAVVQFIADIKKSATEEKRATRAGNVNAYRKAEAGYAAETMMAPSPAATTAAPKSPVTVDFVAK